MIVTNPSHLSSPTRLDERGTVLIIVLWIALGLVAITLYFGNSMLFEFRSSDNATAAAEANQAIEGAARYVMYLLSNQFDPGVMPDIDDYDGEEVPVGDATFWFIGRDQTENEAGNPYFAVVDESSKVNLNTATQEMLQTLLDNLQLNSAELAPSIIDWRDTDDTLTQNGAESETYSRLTPPYNAKNGRFETVDELRLVYGAFPEIIYGEDANRNGILDPNEDDGDVSPPLDNHNGRLDPGIINYVTVYSRTPNKRIDGSSLINVGTIAALQNNAQGGQGGRGGGGGGQGGGGQQQQQQQADIGNNYDDQGRPVDLPTLLSARLGEGRMEEIMTIFATGATNRSVLEFFTRSRMTAQEFDQITGDITTSTNEYTEGLINVNTASEMVLSCIPGIGIQYASSLVARRAQNPTHTNSVAWVAEVLDTQSARQAGPYLTDRSFQYSADIAAVGHYGRGYKRVQFVFDSAEGVPKIIYRRDLTSRGWALGRELRERLMLADFSNPNMVRRNR